MMSSLQSKDFLAGLMFAALGLFGLWLARDLEIGTSDAMATGYFPRMICILMVAIGLVLSAVALFKAGERPTAWHWRPFILISVSTVAFTVLLQPVGFVLTVLITAVLAGFAGRTVRLLPLLALAAVLAGATVGLFVFALRMPIPLWPSVP